MSVVDREALKEAIEILADGSAAVTIEDIKAIRVAIRASIAVLEGEATKWCKTHKSHAVREDDRLLDFCEWVEYVDPLDDPEDCRTVRVAVVPIEGE